MIQEIRIKNFLSFKDETVFSFEATKDTFAEDCQVVKINENTRLSRLAVVYGYNASGKSNLLRAFDFLSKFWRNKPDDPDETIIDVTPFKLDAKTPKEHSHFELLFWVDGKKYWYQLELDQHQVYQENLYYYKTTQPAMLFERYLEKGQTVVKYNTLLKVDNVIKKSISAACLKNMSFFVARRQVNADIPEIDIALGWMRDNVMECIWPTTNLTQYAQRRCEKEKELSQYLLDFLREADFNITGILTETIERPLPQEFMNFVDVAVNAKMFSQELKSRISEGKYKRVQHRTIFNHIVNNARGEEKYQLVVGSDGEEEESRGTLRTYGLESALFTAINQQSLLPIDEIETSLHPKLLEKILYEFLKVNSKSQLIVTTHNDGLLDLVSDLIRKDSVWFTEKKKSGASELYKLTDFRGVNRLSSIREAYRNKRFGATMN